MSRFDPDRPLAITLARRIAITSAAAVLVVVVLSHPADAGCDCGKNRPHLICRAHVHGPSHATGPGDIINRDLGGDWYWVRSPEQERRVAMNTFNRYCIRCHGVDGRGIWDIPDVPDFTNHVWQATRPEEYRSRVILEGRGAVMPSFRGILTIEESWALARYLTSLEPGHEVSRPGLGPAAPTTPAAPAAPAVAPTAKPATPAVAPAAAAIPPSPPAATPANRGAFAR